MRIATTISTDMQGLMLIRLVPAVAYPYFKLVERNREHLSQWGDETSKKYPTLESVLKSITKPDNSEKLRYGIWYRGSFVGTINLTPIEKTTAEVGYWLGKDFCGKGFGAAAMRALTRYAFRTLKYRKLVALVRVENEPSQKLLRNTGFVLEGTHGKLHSFVNHKNSGR